MDVLQHRSVAFYGDQLVAVQAADGAIYVPVSRISESLGLLSRRQLDRIRRHAVLRQGMVELTVPTEGGPQAMQCLRIDLLPLWLAGVNANRVKADVKDKLIRYQAEAAGVLWSAFKHDILPHTGLEDAQQLAQQGISEAQYAYELATAVQSLARQQLAIEGRLSTVEGRVQGMAQWAKGVEQRLGALELEVSPAADITDAQAAELAIAVRNVGTALVQRGEAGGYQRVYGEMYRMHGITSYKRLPRARFDAVMQWLRQWYQTLTGDQLP